MNQKPEEYIPHTIYNASMALLYESASAYPQLNLYNLGVSTAEYQTLQAVWDFFDLNDGITKEKLDCCQAALGLNNIADFKNCLVRSDFLSAELFNRMYQNDSF